MFNLFKKIKIRVKLRHLYLALFIISDTFLFLKISRANSDRVLVAPPTVSGEVSVYEKQIFFNRLREQLNQSFHIVSHKVLEIIGEKGINSIDIEDCTSSKCVRKVLRIIKNLEEQFKTEKFIIFQIVRNEEDTQMTMKYADMSVPEITREFVTQLCIDCGTEKLISNVDILVQRMMKKLSTKNKGLAEKKVTPSEKEVAQPEKEVSPSEKEVSPSEKEIPQPEKEVSPSEKEAVQSKEEPSPLKDLSPPKTEMLSDQTENKVPEQHALDPYIMARDSYNKHIGRLLLDVTYALQIFRSGMVVTIEISLDSSGTVVDQKIIKTSGSQDFDETTMMTLEEIQFEPLPDEMLKFGNYVVILQIQNFR